MTLLQHYEASLLLSTAVKPTLGLWVYFQHRHSKVAQWFCLYSLCAGWWSWCQAQIGMAGTPAEALVWGRAMFCVVVTFPVLLTHFFAAFLGIDKTPACRLGWILVASVMPFVFSDLYLHQSGPLAFLPSFPRAGSLFLPCNLVWFAWVFYGWWLLARRRQDGVGPTRQQSRLLLGAFIFGYATGCVNYLYFYGICIMPLQPLATYGVPIAFLIISYGVFAYGLFDIHVVIQRSLIYSLLVTFLTVGYFGFVHSLERAFQLTFGYQSVRLSLAAFALMALVFQPLKIGIQRLVDRVFFHAPHEELVKRMERLEHEARHTEKLKAVATLASGMAHEIKNPLASIKTFAEYLPKKYNDPDFRDKFARIVSQEIDKINSLVQRLLEFAKPRPPQQQPARLSRLLDETLELLHDQFVNHHIEVRRFYASADETAVDPTQMRQVFLNLMLNSLEAMEQAGSMTIETTAENGYIEAVITDTGPGIDKKDLPHVFDPFYTTKPIGTGLGLAVVHSIVREHGGRITVDSQPGLGTSVRIRLPLIERVHAGGLTDEKTTHLSGG